MKDDLITRQDAKVAMRKLKKWYVVCEEHTQKNIGLRYDDVMFTLDKLPSAQLTQNNTSNALKSLDCIDRKSTIDALDALCDRECEYSKQQRSFMCGACRLGSAFDVIDELPSAQPEHLVKKTGNLVKGLVNDCISRQAAKDALAKFVPYAICDESTESYTNGLTDAYNLICQLPSVQPEKMQLSKEDATKGTTFDCISRQAAIDSVCEHCEYFKNEKLIQTIKDLPSSQPELSDAYMKAVYTWLLDYQIKTAELKGRYTPYEVLSWVVNDWRKEYE